MDVIFVPGAKLVVNDGNTAPDVGVRFRVHRFGEHVKSLEFSKLVGFPCGKVSKGELGWVQIDIHRVPNVDGFHGRL